MSAAGRPPTVRTPAAASARRSGEAPPKDAAGWLFFMFARMHTPPPSLCSKRAKQNATSGLWSLLPASRGLCSRKDSHGTSVLSNRRSVLLQHRPADGLHLVLHRIHGRRAASNSSLSYGSLKSLFPQSLARCVRLIATTKRLQKCSEVRI